MSSPIFSFESPPIPSFESPPKPDDDWYTLYNPIMKELFTEAMNGNWGKVKLLYSRNEKVQGVPITHAKDTLLHVAVSSAPETIVLELLDIVRLNKDIPNILNIKEKTGDTPLHLAAAIGLEKVCRKIVELCPDMVTSARNNLRETPLFSAVRHGNKDAFFELELAIHKNQTLKIDEKDCLEKRYISHCRRDDGNTILHYAIKREQFDLAYEIIYLYPRLVDCVNSSGETALHTLANKPSVFKSGARFGLFDKIIYDCTITEPLKSRFVNFSEKEKIGIYKACCTDVENPSSSPKTGKAPSSGEEDSYQSPSIVQEDPSSSSKPIATSSSAEAQKEPRRLFAKNYDRMILFFKMIVKLLLVVLGIGKWRGQTVAKLKQKHKNALQITKELVDHSTHWGYEKASGGMQSDESSLPSEVLESPPFGKSTPNQDETIPIKAEEKESTNRSDSAAKKGITEIVKKILKYYPVAIFDQDEALEPSSYETILLKAVKELLIRKGMVKEKESTNRSDTESPVLVAAKKGITEIVQKILKDYPVAIFDQDKDEKNIVLLAVEHRRVHVYEYLLMNFPTLKSVFRKLDKEGNGALHLAAKLSDSRLWSTGAALQIQWEIKWYNYVQSSMSIMGRGRSITANNEGKMPEELFIESHDALTTKGIEGLTNTCQLFCSLVAGLFVAFQSVSAVPGGVDEQSGFPILSKKPVFKLFAISSLLSLCFSVISVFVFLSMLISNSKVWDFEKTLPVKLILGLTSFYMAIVFTLVAFCAGDFYVLESLKFAAYPIYAIMGISVAFFAAKQFRSYINLIKQTIIKKVANPEHNDHHT